MKPSLIDQKMEDWPSVEKETEPFTPNSNKVKGEKGFDDFNAHVTDALDSEIRLVSEEDVSMQRSLEIQDK